MNFAVRNAKRDKKIYFAAPRQWSFAMTLELAIRISAPYCEQRACTDNFQLRPVRRSAYVTVGRTSKIKHVATALLFHQRC